MVYFSVLCLWLPNCRYITKSLDYLGGRQCRGTVSTAFARCASVPRLPRLSDLLLPASTPGMCRHCQNYLHFLLVPGAELCAAFSIEEPMGCICSHMYLMYNRHYIIHHIIIYIIVYNIKYIITYMTYT